MNISTLQADARAKFDKELTQSHPGDSGVGGNDPQDPVYEFACEPQDVKRFLDEIILSTVLAVREEVVPETYKEEWLSGKRPITTAAMVQWNECVAELNRRFDSLLGGDAKRV